MSRLYKGTHELSCSSSNQSNPPQYPLVAFVHFRRINHSQCRRQFKVFRAEKAPRVVRPQSELPAVPLA